MKDAVEPTFSENDIETDQKFDPDINIFRLFIHFTQSQNHSRNADIFAEINLILKKFEVSKKIMIFIYQNSKKVMTVILKT